MSIAQRVRVIGGTALAGLLALVSPSWAGDGVFTQLGPFGGPVSALAVDAANARRVYAGTPGGGIFRSEDGGKTWVSAAKGLGSRPFEFPAITGLAVDPRRPQTVYAAGGSRGVFKTLDGGRNWLHASQGLPLTTYLYSTSGLQVDRDLRDTVYVATGEGVFRTVDGGKSWTPRRDGLPLAVVRSVTASADGRTLYAGTERLGVFRSDNRGARWAPRSRGLPANTTVFALAVDPKTPTTLLAGTDRGLFRSRDSGRIWRKVAAGSGVQAFAFHAASRRAFAGTAHGILVSEDAGATWENVAAGPLDLAIASLAASADTVLAGAASPTRLGGVFRSDDLGETWTPSSSGLSVLPTLALAFDPSLPGVLYLGAGFRGIFKSEDGGASWRQVDPTALPADAFIDAIFVDPVDPQIVLAANRLSSMPGLLRSTDAGETWARVSDIVPNRLVADPSHAGVLWSACGGGLFRSQDHGATWSEVAIEHPDFLILYDVELDPRDSEVLWVAGELQRGFHPFLPRSRQVIFRSLDGGATWERRDQGMEDDRVEDLLFDPSDPDRLLAATSNEIWRGGDGGAVWSLVGEPHGTFSGLAAVAARGTLYAARSFPGGVFRSADGGLTWSAIQQAIGRRPIGFLAVDPHHPTRLIAGTLGGLWTYTEP